MEGGSHLERGSIQREGGLNPGGSPSRWERRGLRRRGLPTPPHVNRQTPLKILSSLVISNNSGPAF